MGFEVGSGGAGDARLAAHRFRAAQVRIAAQDKMCGGASEGRGAASACLPGEVGGTGSVAERRGWRGRFGWRRRKGMRRRRLGWWRRLGCHATVLGEIRPHTPLAKVLHLLPRACILGWG